MGNSGNSHRLYFGGLQNYHHHEIERCLLLGRKVMTNLDSICKSRDITLATNVHLVKAMVFPVRAGLWRRLSAKELMLLNCGVGELLRVPWTARRSNQSILKEISPGISLDAKAETPVLWPPHVKSWLIGKASDAGRDWGQEEKGTTEDEMAGWHHWLDGHESEWTLRVGDG